MGRPANGGPDLILYLLDELEEAGQEQVEVRLLSDRSFQEALEAAKEELADLYARNGLPLERRLRFEKKFLLLPEWQRRVAFARDLNEVLAARAVEISPPNIWSRLWDGLLASWFFRPVVATAAVTLVVAVVVVVRFGRPPRPNVIGTSARSEAPSPPVVPSFVLLPGNLKGGAEAAPRENVIELQGSPQTIELRLVLEGEPYPYYDVRIRAAEATGATQLGRSQPQRQAGGPAELRVQVDPAGLGSGRYLIVLQAEEAGVRTDVEGYSVRVVRAVSPGAR